MQDKTNKTSFAMEILSDYKRDNTTLKILLGISIIVNVLIVLFK